MSETFSSLQDFAQCYTMVMKTIAKLKQLLNIFCIVYYLACEQKRRGCSHMA